MQFEISGKARLFLYSGSADMRNGVDGLSLLTTFRIIVRMSVTKGKELIYRFQPSPVGLPKYRIW